MDAAQNAYDVTTPLLRLVPQTALDSVFGASALVTPDLKLSVVGRTWDEFMARSGRSDLGRNALLGSSILLFFRNDEQRRVFESLLHSMHSDELGVHNQVVDLGTKEKPFYVQLHVQGLWQEGVFAGYFLHCLDITREHSNRLALIERDRELMAARETVEKGQQQSGGLEDKLRAASEEIAQREAQLRKMTEKSVRLEKSSKEALERAEKSVEKSTRLQHELDKLKKQISTTADTQAQSEAQAAELAKLATELAQAQGAAQKFEAELNALKEQQSGQSDEVTAAAQELAEMRATLSEIHQQHAAASAEITVLREALAASDESFGGAQQQIEKLREELRADDENSGTAQQQIDSLQEELRLSTESYALLQQQAENLREELALSKQETHTLKTALAAVEEAQTAASEPAHDVTPSAAEEFVQLLAQPACYLDMQGTLVCATGTFWEKLGTLPTQEHDQALTQWLDSESAANFTTWLEQRDDVTCDIMSANGTTWRACAIVGNDGEWLRVVVEELVQLPEAVLPEAPVVTESSEISQAPANSQARVLSRELADEFSNLLTGVLGHASLAAAESDGATSRDILAIEKTAREAAQLVRKLSALSGAGRHVQESDLNSLVKQYVKKMAPGTFVERPQLVMCDELCRVTADGNSLRLVLDALTAHAKENLSGSGQVCYTLSRAEDQACLAVSYEGEAGYPVGWQEGLPPTMGQNGWELIFAREVVRGMGGELDLSEDSGRAMFLATMPLMATHATV